MQPFSSFLRAWVLPPAAATLPSVQPPTFVRFLTFLYWLLSLLYFSQFAVTYFSYFAFTFFFINSCAFSYCLSFFLLDETSGRNVVNSTVCFSTLSCSLNFYTSILLLLHKWRDIFSVAHFGAAILVFRASVLPPASETLPSVLETTFDRFLTFLYWLLFFSLFAVTYFSNFSVTFFSLKIHALSHPVFHFSYVMKPLGETPLILLSVVLPSVAF